MAEKKNQDFVFVQLKSKSQPSKMPWQDLQRVVNKWIPANLNENTYRKSKNCDNDVRGL